ncbi:MAG: DUF4262 domain-containing protein [Daejeonella sp.]
MDENKFSADIESFGWTVILLEPTHYLPPAAYTVGLWKNYQHPELIVFGLSLPALKELLNTGAEMVKDGQVMTVGKVYDDFLENNHTEFVAVNSNNISDYFGAAIDFYKTKDFPALQLVWTDQNNNFPWHADYQEKFKYRQPLLDRNADFKFREEKDLSVFTTRQHLELNSPILCVIHDQDGDWQFLTGDETAGDAKVVSLQQMILKDKTLNEVFDLNYGEQATREFIGGKWERAEMKEAE